MGLARNGDREQAGLKVRIDAALAAATFALHAAFAGRYDFFRDELYFIICGRRPAFGYVDQPPLIPLVAALTQSLGENLILLRLVAALGAAATVYITCAFARLAGGGRFAEAIAGIAVASAGLPLALATTLNTSTFEPFLWTLLAYLVALAVLLERPSTLLWAGSSPGSRSEMKYEIPFWIAALAIGLACTPMRAIFARREMLYGTAIALAVAAPSVVWQAGHGWPFAELLAAAPDKNAIAPAPVWIFNQILNWNPVFALVWIGGVVLALQTPSLRWLSVAFLSVTAMMLLLHGKEYYMAGGFPAMFAIGAVWIEHALWRPASRIAYVAAGLAIAALGAPMALPVLDPPALVGYMRAVHFTPTGDEKGFQSVMIEQLFADQLGWRDFERRIAAVYRALPAGDRAARGDHHNQLR